MPLIRFESRTDPESRREADGVATAATQLIRFLTSHAAYPELVNEVIWHPDPAQSARQIFVMLRTIRPQEAFVTDEQGGSPFDMLQKTLTAFHASVTDATELLENDTWQRGNLDDFLESIVLHERQDEPEYDDLILMIDGNKTDVEKALDLALTFGASEDRHAVQIMMTESDAGDRFFLRMRDLDSKYPLLSWQAETAYRLFYRQDHGCYVEWGYRYPFPDISTLHSKIMSENHQVPIILIAQEQGQAKWYHINDEQLFIPVPHVAQIHLNSHSKRFELTALEVSHLQAQKFRVELSLTSNNLAPDGHTTDSHMAVYHGQRLKERIRNLDMQRTRIERELNHLKDLEQSHFLCMFENDEVDAILRFVSDYPLSRLRHFLYLPCRDGQQKLLHILISKEGASRTDLPGEISHHGCMYIRDRAWHAIGVDVYLSEGFAIRPFIGFENSVQLLHAFEPDTKPDELLGKSFILRPDPGRGDQAIEKMTMPNDEAIELTDALQYINALMYSDTLQSVAESTLHVQTTQFEQQYEGAVGELKQTQEALKQQFTIFLDGMDEDINAAIDDLEYRKSEMDEYAEARRIMTEYVEAVRDLVQEPGNVLYDFLRKETEFHRTLANQIGSIDYRFNIQFESYEHQVKQILHRDQDTLSRKLEELILKIEQEGDVLRAHTESIRNEMDRYRDLPEHLKRGLDELKALQTAIQSYVSNVKEVM